MDGFEDIPEEPTPIADKRDLYANLGGASVCETTTGARRRWIDGVFRNSSASRPDEMGPTTNTTTKTCQRGLQTRISQTLCKHYCRMYYSRT